MKLVLKDKFCQFIGSHPIAGSEKHGTSAAKKDLFQDKNVVLTPNHKNSLEQITKLTNFWELLGGVVTNMKADDHDQIFSTVSHLPHLLAFSLVNLINNFLATWQNKLATNATAETTLFGKLTKERRENRENMC